VKITKVEVLPLTLPYRRPFVLSSGAVSGSTGVLVKIHTDDGLVGIGDSGHGAEPYSGETQDSLLSNIANVYAPRILLGADPFDIETIVARMDKAVRGNNQSKAVVDYALHDLMGKALGVPIYKLLGGKSAEKLSLGHICNTGTPEETTAEAKRVVAAGFRVLKVKVGALSPEQDIENMGVIRRAVGPDIEIMIDANGAWSYGEALRILKKMEPHDIAVAEQPIPLWDVEGLVRLRRKVDIPIFADESAWDPPDLLRLIEREAADGLFIKVAKAGGILKAQRWVSIARAAGLSVSCGCMTGSGLEAAAQGHFLIADAWTANFVQENTGPLTVYNVLNTVDEEITTDLAKELPRYEDGFMWVPEGPGLGVALNEAVVPDYLTPGKPPVTITS